MANEKLQKAKVDEGKNKYDKAYDRAERNHRTTTVTATKTPSLIGKLMGKKPTKEVVHQKAGYAGSKMGSAYMPGSKDNKKVGVPAKTPHYPKHSFKTAPANKSEDMQNQGAEQLNAQPEQQEPLIPQEQPAQPDMLYIAYDGDDAGKLIGQAMLADDPENLKEISEKISLGHEIVEKWVQEHGGQIISRGGDEGVIAAPRAALENIEQLRDDYLYATNLTLTVGVGNSLSEAGKSLMAGKGRGKNAVVNYDENVEQEINQPQDDLAQPPGEMEQPQGELPQDDQPQGDPEDPGQEDVSAEIPEGGDAFVDQSHEVPQEEEQGEFEEPQSNEGEENEEQEMPQESMPPSGEEPQGEDEGIPSESQEGLEEPQGEGEEAPEAPEGEDEAQGEEGEGLEEVIREIEGSLENEKELMAEIDAKGDPAHKELDDHLENEKSLMDHIDEQQAEQTPGDMGLAEDEVPQDNPDLTDVLRDGLDSHAENINRERIIDMTAQALEGFKGCKDILERAKQQAPQLYQSSIMMLKAMIEMAKLLGLEPQEEGVPGQEEQPPQEESGAPQEGQQDAFPQKQAVPQEGTAQDPKTRGQ